jgi:hypothetical protein
MVEKRIPFYESAEAPNYSFDETIEDFTGMLDAIEDPPEYSGEARMAVQHGGGDKVAVVRDMTHSKTGKQYKQTFWVNPKDVKPDDKVVPKGSIPTMGTAQKASLKYAVKLKLQKGKKVEQHLIDALGADTFKAMQEQYEPKDGEVPKASSAEDDEEVKDDSGGAPEEKVGPPKLTTAQKATIKYTIKQKLLAGLPVPAHLLAKLGVKSADELTFAGMDKPVPKKEGVPVDDTTPADSTGPVTKDEVKATHDAILAKAFQDTTNADVSAAAIACLGAPADVVRVLGSVKAFNPNNLEEHFVGMAAEHYAYIATEVTARIPGQLPSTQTVYIDHWQKDFCSRLEKGDSVAKAAFDSHKALKGQIPGLVVSDLAEAYKPSEKGESPHVPLPLKPKYGEVAHKTVEEAKAFIKTIPPNSMPEDILPHFGATKAGAAAMDSHISSWVGSQVSPRAIEMRFAMCHIIAEKTGQPVGPLLEAERKGIDASASFEYKKPKPKIIDGFMNGAPSEALLNGIKASMRVTQAVLHSSEGEYVTLFRGVKTNHFNHAARERMDHEKQIPANVLTSFSTSTESAANFAGPKGHVFKVRVHKSQVVASYHTNPEIEGMGEEEVLVATPGVFAYDEKMKMGGPNKAAPSEWDEEAMPGKGFKQGPAFTRWGANEQKAFDYDKIAGHGLGRGTA